MPWAIGTGIAVKIFCRAGTKPVNMIIMPQRINAPTDCENVNVPLLKLANRAAPGVDQAIVIGTRCRKDNTKLVMPTKSVRENNPEEA